MHISYFLASCVVILVICIVVIVLMSYKKERLIYEHNNLLYTALNTAVMRAYNLIYRNHIMSYQLNNVSLSTNEINHLRKQFLSCVYDVLGPNYKSKLVKLHGSENALDLYILLWFEELLDNDLATQKIEKK